MPVSAHHISQVLENELVAARALLDLLRQEQAYLIAADTDALIGVTERKTTLLARMSELSSIRTTAFAEMNIGTTGAAIQPRLTALGTKVISVWNDLMVVAAEAKELNRTNGLLIARQMVNNQNALQVLQGNANAGRFYGPDGQSSAGRAGRTFAAG